MDYNSDNDDIFEPSHAISVWHNLELCHCDDENCCTGCCNMGKDVDIYKYVEYCKTIGQYVIGRDWYGKKVYSYHFEFKLKSDTKVYKLITNLIMDYSFENKWHWLPINLSFEVVCDGVVLENKTYDFVQKDIELIDELKDYQLVARFICYYNGLPFRSGK